MRLETYLYWTALLLIGGCAGHLIVAVCCYYWRGIVVRRGRRLFFYCLGVVSVAMILFRVIAAVFIPDDLSVRVAIGVFNTGTALGAAVAFGLVTLYVTRRLRSQVDDSQAPNKEEAASAILRGVLNELYQEKRRAGI